jgi:3-isopropylmalate/(R)-2-methylmalate dehydratase large subunit
VIGEPVVAVAGARAARGRQQFGAGIEQRLQRALGARGLLILERGRRDQEIARAEGTLGALLDAGAELLPNACGACAGYGEHRFPERSVAISTTARNFRGRMGAATSEVYLASPYTVAASAVAGAITDPRELL